MTLYQYKIFGQIQMHVVDLAVISATRSEQSDGYFKFYIKDTLVGMFDCKLAKGFKVINVRLEDDE